MPPIPEQTENQKRLLRLILGGTSFVFLILAVVLWTFQDNAAQIFDVETIDIMIFCGMLCMIAVADLIIAKFLFGEKAR